jgi:hypothetical protein
VLHHWTIAPQDIREGRLLLWEQAHILKPGASQRLSGRR